MLLLESEKKNTLLNLKKKHIISDSRNCDIVSMGHD